MTENKYKSKLAASIGIEEKTTDSKSLGFKRFILVIAAAV